MVVSRFPRRPRSTGRWRRRSTAPQAKKLAGLGLRTVGDLLRHYPRRYGSRGELTDLADLAEGERVTVVAQVQSATVRRTRDGKGLLEAFVTDGRGRLRLGFFAGHPAAALRHEGQLVPGRRRGCSAAR